MDWCRQACRQSGRKIHVENSEEMVEEPVFCNDNIQVGNRCICCKNQNDNGVFYIQLFWTKIAHLWHLTNLRENTKST